MRLLIRCLVADGNSFAADRLVFSEDFERRNSEGYKRMEKHKHLEVVKRVGVQSGVALRATHEPFKSGSERIVVGCPLPAVPE